MARVLFENVNKHFGEHTIVKCLNLEIHDKEFLVLVGPSGCGKSTALRMLAGLETVSAGKIYIGERDVTRVPAKDRGVAMVFQSYALYPHMNVYDNMAFGLKMAGVPKAEIEQRVQKAAKMLALVDLLKRTPKQLSGGQRQRVAVGRAIVRNAAVLLMDEPLSNLDAKLRVHMRMELSKLHQELKISTIYVTHDQVEAMTMGDRIAVINRGDLQQVAPPMELYTRPANTFVATFIGSPAMNMFKGVLAETPSGLAFRAPGLEIPLPPPLAQAAQQATSGQVIMGVRPEHIQLTPEQKAGSFAAQVEVVEPMGNENISYLALDEHKIVIRQPADVNLTEGSNARFVVDRMHLFDATSETAIR